MLYLMKLTFTQLALIAFCINLSFGAGSYGQSLLEKKVTLNFRNADLKDVLSKLEAETGVRFIYSQEHIRANRKISIVAKNEDLKSTLTRLFVPLDITYNVMSGRIVLKTSKTRMEETLLSDDATPDRTIKGKVTDEKGGGMIGVSILAKGTNIGTSTDSNGEFSLTVPDQVSILTVSFIGYTAQDVAIGSRSFLEITMQENNQSLTEVVVVGYGSQLKREVTGSVQTVKADELRDLPVAQLTQKLQASRRGADQPGNR